MLALSLTHSIEEGVFAGSAPSPIPRQFCRCGKAYCRHWVSAVTLPVAAPVLGQLPFEDRGLQSRFAILYPAGFGAEKRITTDVYV
jgi:hypothetical protein